MNKEHEINLFKKDSLAFYEQKSERRWINIEQIDMRLTFDIALAKTVPIY